MPISGHLSLGKGEANQRANLKQRNVRPAPYGHETDRSLLTLRRRDSELVLRRYHQTSGGRSQGVAGFIALPRSPFHERSATHRYRSLRGGRQARRTRPELERD